MNKFAAWMQFEGNTDSSVAKRVGVGTVYVWKLRHGKVALSPSFAWKFGRAYGFDLAQKLFANEAARVSAGEDKVTA